MTKKILINAIPEEIRMAQVEDGHLTEFVVERRENGQLSGNIYKGRINNVLPGMQAAFVDIGAGKNAYLYLGDFKAADKCRPQLTAGRDVIVKIEKDAVGTKGPTASLHLTVPGRYVVLVPGIDHVAVSRRIADADERERLKQLACQLKPAGMGLIVRTVAAGSGAAELQRDVVYLVRLWKALTARAAISSAPVLLYRDADLIVRIIRDYLSPDVEQLIVDDSEAFMRLRDVAAQAASEFSGRISHYAGTEDIFARYGLEDEIGLLARRQVELKCGAYLVFDHTEALTVIDVNTGRFVGSSSLENTVLQTNREAAVEIARQLRLRDISGIVIVDFIDMLCQQDRDEVLAVLTAELKRDHTPNNVLGFTALGLVEITRKKSRQSVENVLYGPCPCCHGAGRLQTPTTVAVNVCRELRRVAATTGACRLVVVVHPSVAEKLEKQGMLAAVAAKLGREVTLEEQLQLHPEAFSILRSKD